MSLSVRTLRKKRDRALDRRQQSRLLLDRDDELIVGDGLCGPRRGPRSSGFLVSPGQVTVAEEARKHG